MKAIFFFFVLMTTLVAGLSAQGINIGTGTTFSLGGAILSLPSNWSNAGTFIAGTGTVALNGSINQTIANTSGETFLDLNVNKASGEVVLNNNITINGNLTLTSGDLNLNGDIITLGPSAILNETAGNTVKGTSGLITTTRTLGANPGNVGGLGINISSSPSLGSTTIERGHRPDTLGTSNSITRNYKITPTNNSGLNATASFYYDDSDLNNLTEANLGLFKSTDNGVRWNSVSGTLNTSNNYITASSIGSFSKWSLFSSTNPPVSVETEESPNIPKVYALFQNYPNPFNPATEITFDLPMQSYVNLKIYDVIGREVVTLANEELAAGSYSKVWNASKFSSGLYFYRLEARQTAGSQGGVFASTKKLLLVK
jgi:hypothetical protein